MDIERINYLSRATQLDSGWVSHTGLSKYKVYTLIACVASNDSVTCGFTRKWEMEQIKHEHLGSGAGSKGGIAVIWNRLYNIFFCPPTIFSLCIGERC